MTFIDHNLVAERHTAHILASRCIGKSFHHQVILLRHNHKFHTILPVTKAVEPEVLADKVTSRLIYEVGAS